MRKCALILMSLSLLVGCRQELELADGFCAQLDLKGSAPPDMLMPPPKCAAARGLAGDNLICVDFISLPDQTLTTPPPQQLGGWSFGKDSMNMDCWQVLSGKLQVKNFSSFSSTCAFTMPTINLNDADKQKYSSVVLSIVHRVDINDPNQTAQLSLGSQVASRVFWNVTGKREHQQLMVSLSRTDPLPVATSEAYQFWFQISSTAGFPVYQGWQIDSIAVNAVP